MKRWLGPWTLMQWPIGHRRWVRVLEYGNGQSAIRYGPWVGNPPDWWVG